LSNIKTRKQLIIKITTHPIFSMVQLSISRGLPLGHLSIVISKTQLSGKELLRLNSLSAKNYRTINLAHLVSCHIDRLLHHFKIKSLL